MSGRVLIATSSYRPAMIADMHRARQLAWELPAVGWETEVIAPDATYQNPSTLDPDGDAFFAPGIAEHCVPQRWPGAYRALGLRSIGWRAWRPMFRAGLRLLRARRFDLVYITTTQFPLFLLGPAWRRASGVPYVLDVHDPVYKPGKPGPAGARPSAWHAASAWLARRIEAHAARHASGVVAVSGGYVEQLRERHGDLYPPWLDAERNAVIPFAAASRDLAEARIGAREPDSARARIAYVGAGGPVMERSFALLCRALARLREARPGLATQVLFELRGTTFGWRAGEPRFLAEMARAHGVGDLVSEDPARVTYRGSLEAALEASGVLVLGVDDRDYMPSKLFSCAATGKPLLGVLRRDGPAHRWLVAAGAGTHAIGFGADDEMPADAAARELGAFLDEAIARCSYDRSAIVEPWSAPAMARRHAELFEACRR